MIYTIVNPRHIKDRSGFQTDEKIRETYYMLRPCKRFTYAYKIIDDEFSAVAVICKETFKKLGYIV